MPGTGLNGSVLFLPEAEAKSVFYRIIKGKSKFKPTGML